MHMIYFVCVFFHVLVGVVMNFARVIYLSIILIFVLYLRNGDRSVVQSMRRLPQGASFCNSQDFLKNVGTSFDLIYTLDCFNSL